MTTATTEAPSVQSPASPVSGARFTVASRPQRRFSYGGSVDITNGSSSFAPISLPATGYVRKLSLLFKVAATAASTGAIASKGDAPFNLISGITITDATGQPIIQPISGYNLYLKNKYGACGTIKGNKVRHTFNPVEGPEYAFSATTTAFEAEFRLDLDFEQDANTGYGSIPNLDSNASLQLKIDVAPISNAFTGTTVSDASLSVRVGQWYWAPVGSMVNGVAVQTSPLGLGDYLETRYETQTVNPSSENLQQIINRGGLIKRIIAVSRNSSGERVALTTGTPVGLVLDNNPIDEGILLEEFQDAMRRTYGYLGADRADGDPLTNDGTSDGIDTGVLVWDFDAQSGGRDSWLQTRVGSLLQVRVTPGSGASSLEFITEIAQVRDASAFYSPSSLA